MKRDRLAGRARRYGSVAAVVAELVERMVEDAIQRAIPMLRREWVQDFRAHFEDEADRYLAARAAAEGPAVAAAEWLENWSDVGIEVVNAHVLRVYPRGVPEPTLFAEVAPHVGVVDAATPFEVLHEPGPHGTWFARDADGAVVGDDNPAVVIEAVMIRRGLPTAYTALVRRRAARVLHDHAVVEIDPDARSRQT